MKKTVKCKLVGQDGNAFFLMGHFKNCAKKSGWTKEEIDEVMEEAMSGDYNHLVCVLSNHCENGGF